jgi:hypothetical protein
MFLGVFLHGLLSPLPGWGHGSSGTAPAYLLFLIYKLMPSQIGVSEDLWIFILYFAYTPELS